MNLMFAFVVRNLESDRDSRWIDLTEVSKEEARAEWDRIVDESFDWEIVDLECNFPVDYYKLQYASFETLYDLYETLEKIADNDYDTLIAAYMLENGADFEDLNSLNDPFVIFAGPENSDLAYAIIDEMGFNSVSNADYYFDYESFGRDLRFEGFDTDMEEEDPEYAEALQNMSDYELAQHYIESFGDLKELGQRTIEMHFDYDAYGRDLSFDFDFVEIDGIEGWISNQ
jgi:antirestriction protein